MTRRSACGTWRACTAVKVLPGDAAGYRIAYSADGRLIAASAQGGQVRLWDAHTYQQLADLPHANRVLGLAFSPDSKRLATACGDNTIRLWDLASGQEVCELRGHEAYVHALAFSPDGSRLASASGDFTVRIWDTVLQSVRARPADANLPPHAKSPAPAMSQLLSEAAGGASSCTSDGTSPRGNGVESKVDSPP